MRNFDLYWGIASREGVLFLEHSAVIITARGRALKMAGAGCVETLGRIILDKVKEDSYPWVPRNSIKGN